MPYAITLRLDAAAAAPVASMWQALALQGVSDEAVRLGYPPHVTLAVCADAANSERLLAAARTWAAQWRELPVTLASLGLFPGPPATLFLAPVVTPELLERHAAARWRRCCPSRSIRTICAAGLYRTSRWPAT